jgi:hypothetical protein
MIFKTRSNIDDVLWNNCVANSINSLVYANTWYLDAVVENWGAYVWEERDVYTAVFPIPNGSKFGVKYVYPPFFIQQLGVFSVNDDIPELTKEALSKLNKDVKFTELNLNWKSEIGDQKTNVVLSLNKPYNDLLSEFSTNHKRNIKKAQKKKYKYNSDIAVQTIVDNFRNDKGVEIVTLEDNDYKNFINLCLIAKKKEVLVTRGVFKGEVLITGAVFMKFGKRLVFLFSGNSNEGKTSGGLFNLLNLVIEEFAGSELILDFEGSTNEGLARFYKGFGGEEECYYFYKQNNLSTVLKWLKK